MTHIKFEYRAGLPKKYEFYVDVDKCTDSFPTILHHPLDEMDIWYIRNEPSRNNHLWNNHPISRKLLNNRVCDLIKELGLDTNETIEVNVVAKMMAVGHGASANPHYAEQLKKYYSIDEREQDTCEEQRGCLTSIDDEYDEYDDDEYDDEEYDDESD